MNKITTTNITDIEEDLSEDSNKVLKLSEVYWKDYLKDKNYNKDINKMCDLCIEDQISKYGKQTIKCNGLASIKTNITEDEYLELTEGLSEENKILLECTFDPYLFMDTMIDRENIGKENRAFGRRWYQEGILRCLDGNTPISMSDGSYKAIKDIVANDEVLAIHEESREVVSKRVIDGWYSGYKEIYELHTSNNDYLLLTDEHPVLIEEDGKLLYRSIEEGLSKGSTVLVYKDNKIIYKKILSIKYKGISKTYDIEVEDEHNFIASNIFVHNCTAQSKVVRMGRRCLPEYIDVLMEDGLSKKVKDIKIGDRVISKRGLTLVVNNVINKWNNGIKPVYRITLSNNTTLDLTDNHPVLILNSKDKDEWRSIETGLKVGDLVNTCKDSLLSYVTIKSIKYLKDIETFDLEISTDHNFIANGIVVSNTGKTQSLAMLVVHKMIMNPGFRVLLVSPYAVQTEEVVTTIRTICKQLPENPEASYKQTPTHKLTFNNGSVLMGFTASVDANAVRGQPGDLIVLDECLDGDTQISTTTGYKSIKDIVIGDLVISEFNDKLIPKKVINHKLTGIKETYLYSFENGYEIIATPNHPVFSSEGEVEIHKAKDIRLASIKGEFLKFVRKEFVGKRPVYNITVEDSHNYIANGLLTHNCDDIPEKAITSIMGIKMQKPDVEVWKSGTPKGDLNLAKAEQDSNTKSFHYPSYVNPNYSDELDATLREDFGGGIGYVQEVLGELGLMSNGVFQSAFIHKATQRHTFIEAGDVLLNRSNYICVMGVDWNHDKVGTRIIVVAYDKTTPQFYIIEKERVALEGLTQQAAVDKIISLNRKYNLDHIFVDQGFGATQIGNLKLFAQSQVGLVPKGHPDLKLLQLTGVDFGSNTEITDPASGVVYKQGTKQVAVQNTVLMLERDMIAIHPTRDNDIVLQLKNYIEKSRNKGKVTYGYVSSKIGDHDLDALMFALYGYRLTYSTLFVGASVQGLLKFGDRKQEGTMIDKENLPSTDMTSQIQLRFGANKTIHSSRISSISSGPRSRRSFR